MANTENPAAAALVAGERCFCCGHVRTYIHAPYFQQGIDLHYTTLYELVI